MTYSTQPLSEVAIANFAVDTLDDTPLTTLNDNTVLGRFVKREFGFIRDELLRQHPWAFATERVLLPPLATKPAFGWAYEYEQPSDCVRVLPLTECGELDGRPVPHRVEGKKIRTNKSGPLRVRYIKRVTNPAYFDALFARALGQYLAMMAAQKITGKASYLEKARQLYNDALNNAYLVNSLEMGTPEAQYRSAILDVRAVGVI